MATTIEAPSRWARELGIDHNEMRILSQLALGRLAERGVTDLIVRVGRTYVYGEPLKDAIREMVPVFKKGKSIYLEK